MLIRRAADEDEAFIAIPTFNRAGFIDFEPNLGVAKRCAAGNVKGAVT